MNRAIKTIVSALFIMPVLVSCKGDGKVLSIGEPEFVSGFPVTVSNLKKIEDFNCDEIGIRAVKIVDSLLIIGKTNTWAVYSLDGNKKYGECLRVGNGPGEFTYIPLLSRCHFFKENDSLFVYAADIYKGQLWGFNISEFLTGINNTPHLLKETDNISNALPAVVCGKDKLLIYCPENGYTAFKRLIYENDSLYQMPVTQSIDRITVGSEADMNLLSRITCYNAAVDKFVEAMVYLNQINIISGDGTEGKTICVGKKLDDISVKEQVPDVSRRRDYISMSAWDEGFGAIYSGATDLAYQQQLSNDTKIQFFDWVGNPKCIVEFPYQVLAFNIDFTNKVMYVINKADDKLIAYDATEIIQCLRD